MPESVSIRRESNRGDRSPETPVLTHPKSHEVLGILGIALALYLLASLLSYDALDPSFFSSGGGPEHQVRNYGGRWGAELAGDLLELLGVGALALPVFCALLSWRFLSARTAPGTAWKLVGCALLLASLALVAKLFVETGLLDGRTWERPGGFVGEELHRIFSPLVGRAGLPLLGLTTLLLGVVCLSSRPLASLSARCRTVVERVAARVKERRASRAHQPGRIRPPYTPPTEDGPAVEARPTSVVVVEPVAVSTVREPIPRQLEPTTTGDLPPQGSFPFVTPEAGFQPPPLSLLDLPTTAESELSDEERGANAAILERKLLDFGVEGRVTQAQPGPVITRYEIEPGPGIKINRIVALADDLALALRALSVRVVAPIPGKAVVGVEIPNRRRVVVHLREVLASRGFEGSAAHLPLALGKDIAGDPYVVDLGQMPHLLIAGATGSGKSVCLNALIVSLLYKATADSIRLLLIDPKRVELSIYEGIPHLAERVVCDPKEAAKRLQRLVIHMEGRYKLFARLGARNIVSYNRLVRIARREGGGEVFQPLPYLVVVIDELADLMLTAAADVERAIARLAQMARAVGIHLIVATQRPSVDVITGIIKANFPARLAFQVSSKVDSRTILDMNGAEQLLGDGDMLFIPPGSSKPHRIHGSFVSDIEIKRVVDFLKAQGKAEEFPWLLTPAEEEPESSGDEDDELYRQAVDLVVTTRQASISLIQRRLRIGFNRAARLIERMEHERIVGRIEGGGPREVLIEPRNAGS
ncbi:MAG: cell division protein FtsK [Candidatus Methylomirabilota bacterium]|nr:MAG: cell division protein FtsK [candidate division NC10 bacterium]